MNTPLSSLRRLHELEQAIHAAEKSACEKERLAKRLDAKLLTRYRQALQRHGETALAELQHGNVCSGCYMRQPVVPQRLAENICQCQNCGRLLYDADVEMEYLLRS